MEKDWLKSTAVECPGHPASIDILHRRQYPFKRRVIDIEKKQLGKYIAKLRCSEVEIFHLINIEVLRETLIYLLHPLCYLTWLSTISADRGCSDSTSYNWACCNCRHLPVRTYSNVQTLWPRHYFIKIAMQRQQWYFNYRSNAH